MHAPHPSEPRPAILILPCNRYQVGDLSAEALAKEEAGNCYVSFQMIMAVVGIRLFLFFFAPMLCRQSSAFGGSTIQLR